MTQRETTTPATNPTSASTSAPTSAAAPRGASRRGLLGGAAAVTAAGALVTGQTTPASALPGTSRRGPNRARLTVLGTTDLHGNVFNWNYFKDAEYDDSSHRDIGLAKVRTLVEQVRHLRDGAGEGSLTIDAGDTIQGTPLAYYYARVEPIGGDVVHPMATAMNLVGYDAAALGNHEFNYGIDTLRTFESQLDFPLLGANAVDADTGLPAFKPYVIRRVDVGRGRKVKVGILGLTNPGIALWDKANVEGRMEFPGLVPTARRWVRELRKEKKCDVVIVSAHSGADTSSSYGDTLPAVENAATLVARRVGGIDAILVGHAHQEIAERFVTNKHTGKKVLLTEPLYWGMRLSVIDLELRKTKNRRGRTTGWEVVDVSSRLLDSADAVADEEVLAAVQANHDTVVDYVNSVVGTSSEELLAARAVVEDVPIIDFVNYVQADTVAAALAEDGVDLPVLSIAAPFSRSASFPAGDVTVRDVAGLYIYDNTLLAVKVTGAQVKDYLEYSARYFQEVTTTGPVPMDDVTNAVTATAPNGTPDYNYDAVAGLPGSELTYDIDLAQPVGSRITNLAYAGSPVDEAAEFALAVNNYRQSGGGGFPHVSTAEVVYNRQVEIRQLLIDWVSANGTIDPAAFASVDWRLVTNGEPITVE
ncbi:bifunctional metallophosphatase/5'-nucleotidase [Nocardioides bruguierae]|uniref:bifunctional metallophosphatase/5'-nucleotidase n=1 Tax=Nocardioides bruguierae TaxID=2945102 RepID=UPI0020207534|nr:5'-nucleotidase C-terminal domain-containing protein [Nocardioides bruguierae]MCL8025614.1 5'-nucleotidase C-terminal domain-containing protein [Nocardioides bruguierae]